MDYDVLTKNAYNTWVVCYIDSNDFKWFSRNLFPSQLDAKRWGQHMKNDLRLCEKFRTYPLRDILSLYEDSLNRYLP